MKRPFSDFIEIDKQNILFNDIDYIDVSKDTSEQIEDLKEDLMQIGLNNGLIIDVGWYPSFNPSGNFILYVIKNNDWNNPINVIYEKKINLLITKLNETIKEFNDPN